MRNIIAAVIFIFLSLITYSQNSKIENIRKLYNEINEHNYQYHDVTMNAILPVVGEKTKTVRLYFSAEQKDPELDPYEMVHTLYKVEIKYNISSSSFLNFEYLYNEKGELIFHFEKVEGIYENHEKRYYYDTGKLIMCKIKIDHEDGKKIDYTNQKAFTRVDLKEANGVTEKAKRYQNFFEQLVLLDKVD